jgi:hypothetical protein
MKKILCLVLSFFFIFCLFKCAVYNNIYSEYDHSVDFTKYKTFAWLPDSGITARKDSFRNTAYDNDVIRNNAKNYITHQLTDRGLTVHVNSPDALFQLILLNEKRQRIITSSPAYYPMPYYYGAYHFPYYLDGRTYYPYYYPYYDYYTYYGWGCADFYCNNNSIRQTYVKGTIIINMYDRKQKKMIWTASAEGNIYDPNTIKEEVDPAIKKMMKDFPVKPENKTHKSDMYVGR